MEEELIRIRWHVDRSRKPTLFMLICEDPVHEDLQVRVSEDEITERVAKARLMQEMYELGEQKGFRPWQLRFKINGIEE